VLKQISEGVGLLAAVVAVVYLLGAFVLAVRLQTNDIPTLPVLSNLPRELVISYGLTYAVVWWLLGAAIVAVFWLALQRAPSGRMSRQSRRVRWSVGGAVLAALVILSWLGAALVLDHLDGKFTWWDRAARRPGSLLPRCSRVGSGTSWPSATRRDGRRPEQSRLRRRSRGWSSSRRSCRSESVPRSRRRSYA
jgi:hypothetical protein